jgi:hypothetical protein
LWEQTGERQFLETHVHFRYDEQGTWVALTKVRWAVTLNETMDEFTGVGIAEDIDRDGNVVATRRPSTTYQRMPVEPARVVPFANRRERTLTASPVSGWSR